MTAPNRPAADQNAAKGIVLLVVVVLIGVILLAKFGGSSSSAGKASTASTTSTTLSASTTTLATSTGNTSKLPSLLKVAVFNGTGGRVTKAAGNTKAKLVSSGYSASNITVNDTTPRVASIVYYGDITSRADAAAVARTLGLSNSAVQAVGSATLPAGSTGNDVIVIIGSDAVDNPTIAGTSGTSGTTSGTSGNTSGTSGTTSGTSGTTSGTSGRSGTSG